MRPESVGAADGGDAARRSTSHRRHLPDGCFHSCGPCGCIFSGAYASSQAASSERHTAQIASTEENPAREAVAVRTHTRRAGGYSGGPRGRLADPSGGALHRSLLAPLPFFSSVSMAAGSGLCLLAVALLAAAWISDGSSSNKQAHSNQQYVNCMPCSRTYVADAYVGALTNQLSQHHDLTEVPDTADLCKGLAGELDVPTLSEVNRQLVGEGSHRRLIYSAKFANSKDAMVKFLDGYDANLVIIEKLPSGVFADPFELQHFVERKGFAVDCVCFQHR